MIYRFDTLVLDAETHELLRDGESTSIEPQVFRLPVHLMENRDRIVSNDDLVAAVWDGRIVSKAKITSCLNFVRLAVGDSVFRQEVIKPYPKTGFQFVGTLVDKSPARQLSACPAEPPQDSAGVSERSLVILRFTSILSDPENALLAEGIAADVAVALARAEWLRVILFVPVAFREAEIRAPDDIARKFGALRVERHSQGNRQDLAALLSSHPSRRSPAALGRAFRWIWRVGRATVSRGNDGRQDLRMICVFGIRRATRGNG